MYNSYNRKTSNPGFYISVALNFARAECSSDLLFATLSKLPRNISSLVILRRAITASLQSQAFLFLLDLSKDFLSLSFSGERMKCLASPKPLVCII